jgi:hypothetical protein
VDKLEEEGYNVDDVFKAYMHYCHIKWVDDENDKRTLDQLYDYYSSPLVKVLYGNK